MENTGKNRQYSRFVNCGEVIMFITEKNLKDKMETVYCFGEMYDNVAKEFNEMLSDKVVEIVNRHIHSEEFIDKIIERINRKQLK